jgi:hypothetical protein
MHNFIDLTYLKLQQRNFKLDKVPLAKSFPWSKFSRNGRLLSTFEHEHFLDF